MKYFSDWAAQLWTRVDNSRCHRPRARHWRGYKSFAQPLPPSCGFLGRHRHVVDSSKWIHWTPEIIKISLGQVGMVALLVVVTVLVAWWWWWWYWWQGQFVRGSKEDKSYFWKLLTLVMSSVCALSQSNTPPDIIPLDQSILAVTCKDACMHAHWTDGQVDKWADKQTYGWVDQWTEV